MESAFRYLAVAVTAKPIPSPISHRVWQTELGTYAEFLCITRQREIELVPLRATPCPTHNHNAPLRCICPGHGFEPSVERESHGCVHWWRALILECCPLCFAPHERCAKCGEERR